MNFSIIKGAQISGLEGQEIQIETDITRGLSNFTIIGLANKTVEESRDRILAALKNSDLPSPKSRNQRVVVSLLPSDVNKNSSGFDLPIAISYLVANGEISGNFSKYLFVGELSLNGQIKSVSGIIPIILMAKQKQYEAIFIPKGNETEAKILDGIKIFTCENLRQVYRHLKNQFPISPIKHSKNNFRKQTRAQGLDFFKIQGQDFAKRGVQIAVAGGHNIAFYGSPGSGKTFLAKTIRELLPEPDYDKKLECQIIKSISSREPNSFFELPFRSPHHSASYSAIIGGGAPHIKPGEITLAHNGILFMDEFPEFNKNIIEALRQPMEEGSISISRMNQKVIFPANFLLIVAMNPCPCGFYKSTRKKMHLHHERNTQISKKDFWTDNRSNGFVDKNGPIRSPKNY